MKAYVWVSAMGTGQLMQALEAAAGEETVSSTGRRLRLFTFEAVSPTQFVIKKRPGDFGGIYQLQGRMEPSLGRTRVYAQLRASRGAAVYAALVVAWCAGLVALGLGFLGHLFPPFFKVVWGLVLGVVAVVYLMIAYGVPGRENPLVTLMTRVTGSQPQQGAKEESARLAGPEF